MNEFYAHFNFDRLHGVQFLNWIVFSNIVPEIKIAKVMRANANACSKPLKLIIFASFPDLDLQRIGTEQIC